MKLLFLSTEFPNQYDPIKATFNYDLIKSLSINHDVEVISPISWTEEFYGRLFIKKNKRQSSGCAFSINYPRYYFIPKLFRKHFHLFLWWSLKGMISELQNRSKPDCILSYWTHPDGSVAVKLAKTLGTRSVIIVGGSDILVLAKLPDRRKEIIRALQETDAIISVSEDLKRHITALGISSEKIHVICRGVDQKIFHSGSKKDARTKLNIPEDRKVALCVGRLVKVKSVKTIINAMQRLHLQFPKLHLYLLGDGPLMGILKKQVASASLIDKIHFIGNCPHHKLGNWYRAADVTVLASVSEGIPNVLLESLACGTPFVASNVGGIPEISQTSSARLFPPKDALALCKQLEFTLNNKLKDEASSRTKSLSEFAQSVARIASLKCN
ncbi:MAG: hypothetical protein COA78_06090 [Blastopirellula sp.]|nr:MAG: hypothetical protein COA78_06090 [Blastopirellula sp.]